MANLDNVAARYAQEIISKTSTSSKDEVENLVTRALGVFQEQGIYAGMLYLVSRGEREKTISQHVRNSLVAILNDPALHAFELGYTGNINDTQALLNHFIDKVGASSVQTLLLIKSLYEQTLTYARYGAKAREEAKN